jgi:hypothetical protein
MEKQSSIKIVPMALYLMVGPVKMKILQNAVPIVVQEMFLEIFR